MDDTNGFATVKQVSKVKCNFSEPTETRGPLVWCNPTIKAYGYEHPIARTPTEDMDSGKKLSGLLGPQVALLVSVRLVAAALDLAQKEAEDAQEDLRNEIEPATQKRKECMKEVIDLEDQSQGTRSSSIENIRVPTRPTEPTTQPPVSTPSVSYSNPVNPPGHHPESEAGPSSLDRLSPGPGLEVLEFENDKERARRLLVNTHRLLEAHVGKMVKGASNHQYSEFVQRGHEMDGFLTHAITQLSDWYETLEVENYEGFEWDDSHGKRKAEDSP
ncbi:hypothetical protein PPACK8108_LOCUS19490 [Phakopsora pachyrhizi]|uniref:Uncharacterized protein n=1 Tax=Phakopsora pachyrhizi TaxID=170000 RepID=A0AAV0BDQ7_PHAPC|nr:hypothetical protein PPACK8108_LOCUS19490 [Phakopsora pachyrhizi]